ncbi:MAG: amidoligase family protein, partial [Wenzhouxiangella sp.]
TELGIDIGEGPARENIESILSRVAGLLVPLELVGPPVPWTELATLDRIRQKLHLAGARGTHSSAFYAFGLQLNIETARLEADHLLAILRAFLLKFDWLLERNKVDLARKLSPYIQDFPEDYVIHVLQDSYRPDQTQLIDDFLDYTPTRNRPLDLLPLFAFLDSDRVLKAPVEKALIKPRPAFHYRLPNCLIDEPDWSLAFSWNDWVAVERLAADTDAIARECNRRLAGSSLFKWLVSGTMRWIRS